MQAIERRRLPNDFQSARNSDQMTALDGSQAAIKIDLQAEVIAGSSMLLRFYLQRHVKRLSIIGGSMCV